MNQRFEITTPNAEKIYTIPGKNGPNDMKIFTQFPYMPWAHSLCYIGHCLRLKAEVEDRNYPPEKGFQGRGKLMTFIYDCVFNKGMSVEEICRKHGIPTREG
jgi:hypothetical protein